MSADNGVDPGAHNKGALQQTDPMSALPELLKREPTEKETAAWAAMGPSHRRRTADRIALIGRWTTNRGDLTAQKAAETAGLSVKYFYQMVSAWKRTGTLAALGALTTAKATRGPRLNAAVTNAIQANVAKVLDEGKGLSVEAMRRNLEQAAHERLLRDSVDGKEVPKLPSARTMRTFIERELVRRVESALPGAMVVMDACPVTMRRADGTPHVLFAVIDRGTGLVFGHALGKLGDSATAYTRAAMSALDSIETNFGATISWVHATARLDLTVGEDVDACAALLARYAAESGLPELGAIERANRFGAAFRRFVGDRVGRIQFRPTWLRNLPPMEQGTETFDDAEASVRADADVAAHNRAVIHGLKGLGQASPPENLLAALRFLAG